MITVPPLRERVEDILPLAYAFAMNMASELKRRPLFPGFQPRASSSLLRHEWPGNVRELKNADRAFGLSVEQTRTETSSMNIAFDPFDSPFTYRFTMRRTQPAGRYPMTPQAPAAAAHRPDFERLNETTNGNC